MDFKWDDDLIKEMIWNKLPIPDHYASNIQKCLDEFKRSKELDGEYEIISFQRVSTGDVEWVLQSNGKYENVKTGWGFLSMGAKLDTKKIRIFSIRRLSDDVIFTLGDETKEGVVQSFRQNYGGNKLWISTDDEKGYGSSLDSAEKVERKDYEILERFEYSKYACDGDLSPIKSVKRLPDGEIFTVGDGVIWGKPCNILRLFISSNGLMWCDLKYHDGNEYHNANIGSLDKAKEVLFTTEDGVGIFAGEEFYLIYAVNGIGYPNKTIARKELLPFQSYQKTFSTREVAEDWLIMNKPLLSLDDLLSVWGSARPKEYYSTSPLFESFKELAKSKL